MPCPHACTHTCTTDNTHVPVRILNGKLTRWMAPLHSAHTSGMCVQVKAPQLDQHGEATDETVPVPPGSISSGAGWQHVDTVSCGVRDKSG